MLVKVIEMTDGTYIRLSLDDVAEHTRPDRDLDLDFTYYIIYVHVYWVGRRAKRSGGRAYTARLLYSGKTGMPYRNKAAEAFHKFAGPEGQRVDAWVGKNFKKLLAFGKTNPFKNSWRD